MRDGDHRLALHQAIQTLLDCGLDFAVEGAGGLVEQENRSVLQHDACDGDALALATAQLDSALAHMGVVAAAPRGIAQGDDELVRLGAFRRGDHLGVARSRAPIADVVADRSMQQRCVLSDHADLRPQTVLSPERDILTVDQHPALMQVVEAQQQIDDRCFFRHRSGRPGRFSRPVEYANSGCRSPAAPDSSRRRTRNSPPRSECRRA